MIFVLRNDDFVSLSIIQLIIIGLQEFLFFFINFYLNFKSKIENINPKHWKKAKNQNYIKHNNESGAFLDMNCICIYDSLVKEHKNFKFEKKEINNLKYLLIKKFKFYSSDYFFLFSLFDSCL
jgi:hypothetical protein